MLTKRAAIVTLFVGVLAKMAHADEPPDPTAKDAAESGTTIRGTMVWNDKAPITWSVNLDRMKQLDVYFGDKKASVSAAEIFAALLS